MLPICFICRISLLSYPQGKQLLEERWGDRKSNIGNIVIRRRRLKMLFSSRACSKSLINLQDKLFKDLTRGWVELTTSYLKLGLTSADIFHKHTLHQDVFHTGPYRNHDLYITLGAFEHGFRSASQPELRSKTCPWLRGPRMSIPTWRGARCVAKRSSLV